MPRRVQVYMVVVLLLVAVVAPLQAQAPETKENPQVLRFRADLENLRQRLLIPGLSAAIVENGSILWAGGLGYRDEAAHLPATENTRYPIASLTKCFTAAAAMQLVERKRLNLDDPAAKYHVTDDSRVRVQHYLAQMSEAAPGTRFLYNSERFNHLTAILEKASRKPLRTLFEEELFRPAGMSSTSAGPSEDPELRNELATGYEVNSSGRAVRAASTPAPIEAASGIVSSVADLVKFDIALDKDKLLKPKFKWEMWTPSVSQLGTTPYGLGWFVETWAGQQLIWHYGQLPGYSALFLKIPQKHLTLILLANSSTLSSPFPLQFGQVLFSPFASAFLRDFIAGSGATPIKEPDWNLAPDALNAQLGELEKAAPYSYEYELVVHAFMATWRGEKERSNTLFRLALHRYPDLMTKDNEPAFLFAFARSDDPGLQRLGERIGAALLARDPGNSRTRFDVGVLLVHEKRCREAAPLLERVLAREDASTPIRAWSGYMLAECVADNNPREAESVLGRVIRFNNNSDGVLDEAHQLLKRLQSGSRNQE